MVKTKKESKEKDIKEIDSLFKKTLNMLNSEDGKDIFDTLTTFRNKPSIGISTGSLGLDYVISPKAGGMPKGHCIEFYGAYSTGKSTLALGICANATANKEQVVYVDSERSFSWETALNAGVDENYFTLCQHRDARLVANYLETLMKTGEVGVVVIDSIPFWKPLLETKKGKDDVDITRAQMAFHASFLTNTLPILAQVASDHGVILIFVNQERKNLSGYGGGSNAYGCEALKHLDSVRLRLTGNAKYKDCKIMDSEGNLVGQYVGVLADKNKLSGPMRETSVPLFFGRGINPYMEIAVLSIKLGVVNNVKGRIRWPESEDQIAHGLDNYTQELFDDKELYYKVRDKVRDILGLTYSDNRIQINSFHDNEGEKREAIGGSGCMTIQPKILEEALDE